MDDFPGPVFHLPEVIEMRTARVSEIETLLDPAAQPFAVVASDSDLPLRYTIVHHRLEAAERVARLRNHHELREARAVGHSDLEGLASDTPTGRTIVICPPRSEFITSESADTPYYLVSPTSTRAAPEILSRTSDAMASAAAAGFEQLIGGNVGILCLMARRAPRDTFNSWTITRLPGTVYTDYSDHHELLARDTIHEAGHNWLNDALTSLKIRIPACVSYYSPWKGTVRPAFGFLHACWAFPLTIIYAAQAAETSSGARSLLQGYLTSQRPLLAQTGHDHLDALRLISDSDLQDRLKMVYDQARSL